MLKKLTMIMMAFTLIFVLAVPDQADARRGGFKSGPRSYTPAPKKSTTTDNVRRSDNTGTKAGTTAGTTGNRGFFGGGSFMKGLMVGGLAGMLFGGLFGGMGFLGNLLGLAVNIFAIYLLIVVVMALVRRFKKRPSSEDPYRNNGGRY